MHGYENSMRDVRVSFGDFLCLNSSHQHAWFMLTHIHTEYLHWNNFLCEKAQLCARIFRTKNNSTHKGLHDGKNFKVVPSRGSLELQRIDTPDRGLYRFFLPLIFGLLLLWLLCSSSMNRYLLLNTSDLVTVKRVSQKKFVFWTSDIVTVHLSLDVFETLLMGLSPCLWKPQHSTLSRSPPMVQLQMSENHLCFFAKRIYFYFQKSKVNFKIDEFDGNE